MTENTDKTSSILLRETRARVRVLTFNRPERRNAFTNALYLAFANALNEAVEDPGVGSILITGAGTVFCAGQDLEEMSMPKEGEPLGFVQLLEALSQCDKPIIAAVAGFGVGIGATMLLHTDINIMAESARLRFPFVALGVVPEAGSSALLPMMIGYQRAAEILYTSRWVDAKECVQLGLALKTVTHDALMSTAMDIATRIAHTAPSALRHTKRLIRAPIAQSVQEAMEREYEAFPEHLGSSENIEAIQAFFEKRAPRFFEPQEDI